MKRTELKAIIKECLREILLEGLDTPQRVVENVKAQPVKRVHPTNNIVYKQVHQPTLKQQIVQPQPQVNVKSIVNDPILASIMEDTAKSTMLEQANAERSGNRVAVSGDAVSRLVESSDPHDLFGEAASIWSTLAFAEKKLPGQ